MSNKGPKVRGPPPAGTRKSKAFKSPLERMRAKQRRNNRAQIAKRSEEMQALVEAEKREKMLSEYYDSVRKCTANVKDKLLELESLGGSESDGALMDLQPPSYASLGINVGDRSLVLDYVSSDDEERDSNQDDYCSEDSSDKKNVKPKPNVSIITSHLKETSEWLKKTTERDLAQVRDAPSVTDDSDEDEKEIKEPAMLFGSETHEARMHALLGRCEDVMRKFRHNLSVALESEHRRMKQDVQISTRWHKALDARIEAIRADITSVDRQIRKYRMSDLEIREMIEKRLIPQIRELETHASEQVKALESYEALFLQTKADLNTAQAMYTKVTDGSGSEGVAERTCDNKSNEGEDMKSCTHLLRRKMLQPW